MIKFSFWKIIVKIAQIRGSLFRTPDLDGIMRLEMMQMKDIPMFTTENGVASLFLREIPYRKRAHIKIQATQNPEELLQECVDFCRACGAEWADASGHPWLETYPRTARILAMCRSLEGLPQTDAALFPVTEETVKMWLDIYNERMAQVPNTAWMSAEDGRRLLKDGDGYFIHRNGELLGIGQASGDRIDTVAAVQKGAGREIVLSLASLLTGDTVNLWVADTNAKAIRLYESLGFITTREVARWYRVL